MARGKEVGGIVTERRDIRKEFARATSGTPASNIISSVLFMWTRIKGPWV